MGKKLPLITLAERTDAAQLAELPGEVTLALADVAATMRDGLLAMSCAAGLAVMNEIMHAELTGKLGPKGKHLPERPATRHGSTSGSVVLGGRTVSVTRPRARTAAGGEVSLDSWALFSDRDLLTQLVLERMLAGVATRRHLDVAEPVGADVAARARSTSKSTISRQFKAATEAKLAELLARDLSALDVAVLMIDGVFFAGTCIVCALVITTDGTKVPVGLWDGDTENTTVVTDLLADLVARGLRYDNGILVVIDGAKALRRAVAKVFGARAVVQRCVLHKRRNVGDYLPDELAATIDLRLAAAFNDTDPVRGQRICEGLARQLQAQHPSAAASLREGLEEMFTVRRLGVSDRLAHGLSCTNNIESMMSVIRRTTNRVTKWKDTQMIRRWVGAGMLEAERGFRRIKGYKDMPVLVAAVHREVAKRVGESSTETVTPKEYGHVA
jgi:transposase-like protein